MSVEKPGHQGVWCSNCGYEFSSEPQGEPCPSCGHSYRTHGVVLNATAKGTASTSRTVGKILSATAKGNPSMSKTVGVTISAISKGSASMSASWEEWSELRERNRGWSIVEFIVAFGPSFLGWFIDGISGVVVGLIFGALGLWVGPKAATTVREKVRMTTRSEGQ